MAGVTSLAESRAGMNDAALYDYDFPAWCDLQADRLRHLASTLTGDDLPALSGQ
jgi:hypothetical protein